MSVGAGAMMAGSVLANKMGADAQSSARNGVLNAANAAQQGFQQQATDKFNATLPLASRENADKNAGAAADVRAANDQALLGSIGAPAPTPTSFSATFNNVRGNNWWIETTITANKPLAGVDVRVNEGDWRALTRQSWGAYAASFNIPTGSVVQLRARATSAEVALSNRYTWPNAAPAPNPVNCLTAGCTGGALCCQVSGLNNIPEAQRSYQCLAPTTSGTCPARSAIS